VGGFNEKSNWPVCAARIKPMIDGLTLAGGPSIIDPDCIFNKKLQLTNCTFSMANGVCEYNVQNMKGIYNGKKRTHI